MAMGKKGTRDRQASMGGATADLPKSAGHPFYARLNHVLDDAGFDTFVEAQCAPFYADGIGRPSLAPSPMRGSRAATTLRPVPRTRHTTTSSWRPANKVQATRWDEPVRMLRYSLEEAVSSLWRGRRSSSALGSHHCRGAGRPRRIAAGELERRSTAGPVGRSR